MNILTQNNQQSMTSQQIADLVGKRHDNVKRTIDMVVASGVIVQPQIEDGVKSANGVVTKVYVFSGEQGKRDSIIVVAQLSPEFTAALVDRWQELEQQVSKPAIALPHDYISALEALLITKKGEQAALEQVKELQPKADALDFISTAVNSLNARDTAKTLGVQPQKFNKWCIAHNWMYRDSQDKLQMCSNRLQQGYMEQRNVTYYASVTRYGVVRQEVRATTQPLFTAKGLARLASIFSIVHEVA